MKTFRFKSDKSKVFDSILQLKSYLGLSPEDTVFDYCKRTGEVLQMKNTERVLRARFHTVYDWKNQIGV